MTTNTDVTAQDNPADDQTLRRSTALVRGLVGWLVPWTALGLSIGVGLALKRHLDASPALIAVVQALVMVTVVLTTILLLRARLDRRPLAGLGWGRRIGPALLIGTGVAVVTGLLTWVPVVLAGWVRVTEVRPANFLLFLVANGVIIVAYEALPEEVAFRGYVWSNLRDGWGLVVATAITTVLFPLGGIVANTAAWLVGSGLGAEPPAPTFFPAGSDPIAYVLQLGFFGLALVAARRLPIDGALFVAVAFHAAHLTVNRLLLGGNAWLDSGWTVTFVQPDAIALVLVNLILAGLTFIAIRKHLERRAKSQPETDEL